MSSAPNHLDLAEQLSRLAPIHFVGVGGSGMAPLAELVATYGISCSGSDLNTPKANSYIRYYLQGSDDESRAIRSSTTVVYSSAIATNHPSMLLAAELKKNVFHRSDLLAIFSESFKTIAVSGTHGKTTTSAMICHILRTMNLEPSWVIGANFADGRPAFRRGHSDLLVIEADESDGTFLKYRPFISIVNNIEPDHMDFYITNDRLRQAFSNFLDKTSNDGCIVYCKDDPTTASVALTVPRRHVCFGTSEASDSRLLHSRSNGLLMVGEVRIGKEHLTFKLPMAGKHNAINAVGALSACGALGLDVSAAAAALTTFPGVARRLQVYPSKNGALIFDDYAHNPGKIRSCLSGLSAAFPSRRIIAVFQPHRFSRIASLYDSFVESFSFGNIRVVVLPVYAAGEPHRAGFEPTRLAEDIGRESGVKTFSANSLKEAADLVKSMMDPNLDLLVTIGAGDVWHVAKDISERC